jgi:hypothetical protein
MNALGVPEMDVARLVCSAALLEPKQPFFDWLRMVHSSTGVRIERIHFPEEDTVWLIPPIPRFSTHEACKQFLKELKPRVLRACLAGFILKADQLATVDESNFDQFFELKVRDKLRSIEDLFS